MDGAGRWVWVVNPDCYLDGAGREHPKLGPGAPRLRWACHRDTRPGDLVVLYRSQRAKDLAYLLRATSEPSYEPGPRPWNCEAEVLERFDRPVPLAELRADPVTAGWPALRASFVRTGAPVPDDVWERVMAMAGASSVGAVGRGSHHTRRADLR
ncbi:EVE domain-containing protein [Actinomycetospora endophytica]|uniref:EVE domain-containing protein n=1 Tax=Actinomycetospora endophytica TaxID=2291215 RepID=A0ABS8P2Y5_9PSEU|nr:EVE domain-containing protein [Actinomycetospora endophytica]MCD2192614.1 EVE domain-containing protein [Actinomycetospora endophytica]